MKKQNCKTSSLNLMPKIILWSFILSSCSSASDEQKNTSNFIGISDYQRAEKFLQVNTDPLVTGKIQRLFWQEDDRLIYERTIKGINEFIVADLSTGKKTELFNQINFAKAISEATNETINPHKMDLREIEVDSKLNTIKFLFNKNKYSFDRIAEKLTKLQKKPSNEFISPDGTKAVFIENNNLWVRDMSSGEVTQLTFDGMEDYGYATNNAGWIRDDRPVILWSPDSQKIATFKHDGRNVGEMYLVTTEVGHSELDAWKYPLPGDREIFTIERIVIHLDESPQIVKLNMPPDAHRSSIGDHVADRDGSFLDVVWNQNGDKLFFVSTSRDHKTVTLQVADSYSGEVRKIYSESVPTYYESGYRNPNWRILFERNEFIWYSEQDNWGHLYLHDLETGRLKRKLTSGDWPVLNLEHVDLSSGDIYFTAANLEGGDPYHHYLYRVNLVGGSPELITPNAGHHVINWSNSSKFFVDSYSTPDTPSVTVIRDKSGKVIMPLEEMDITDLKSSGWVAPESFSVKARDNVTDLYGLLYKPTNLDPSRSYPILNYIYPGPQTGSVGSRSFRTARRDKQAIAELGFIVVEVDAMGTPGRSKSFHDIFYGDMGDNGLIDQITTIRQLAEDRPWMDLDRVGVWGHSGGGFASTGAILRYPDFYKVAVSSAGNHDNRNYEDAWGEKWQGLLEVYSEYDKKQYLTNYDSQANQLLAKNLKGKLLLAHGLLDDNVPPSNTLLVVQALIEAEKDFDLILFPEERHGFGDKRYFMKKRWDYFVEHLHGIQPPEDFRFNENIR